MTTNQQHTEYGAPVVRAASPASSVGTSYGVDQTSLSDSELPQSVFEAKCLDELGLHNPRLEEDVANLDPLLPRPTSENDRFLQYQRILWTLSERVHALEENELFEQTLLRGSHAALVPQPSSSDVDALMRSMMGPAMSITAAGPGRKKQAITDGPWNNYGKAPVYEGGGMGAGVGVGGVGESMVSATTVGKRSRNGRSRKG